MDEDDEWVLYDTIEKRYYDIDLAEYQKEQERLQRNHVNLHEKYEELKARYEEYYRKYNRIKSNTGTAKRVYMNLKECFEGEDLE